MTMISRIASFDNYISRSNLWCWKLEIEIEDFISFNDNPFNAIIDACSIFERTRTMGRIDQLSTRSMRKRKKHVSK